MTESDAPDESAIDADFDRTASMFGEGAPDVGIGGLDIWRSTIVPVDDEGSEESGDDLHWHISALPSLEGSSHSVSMMGDLSLSGSGWFIGVSATMHLVLAGDRKRPDPDDVDEFNELGRVLGPWVSNALYDVAAMRARQLVASSAGCHAEFPLQTPKAHITVASEISEVSESSADDPE